MIADINDNWIYLAIAIGVFVVSPIATAMARIFRKPDPPPVVKQVVMPECEMAIAEPVCVHEWEKDGDRVIEKVWDGDAEELVDETWQPCQCKKCGTMTTFRI